MDIDHWQRLFAYTTGSIVIGLLLIVFTHSLLQYVNAEGATGYVALMAYGFVYLNLGYGLNRRFALKAKRIPALHYTLSFLMAVPTLLWIFTKDEGLGDQLFIFTVTILFAVFLGTYFGIKRGSLKRSEYLGRIREEQEEKMPDDLKRPHDDLSKN